MIGLPAGRRPSVQRRTAGADFDNRPIILVRPATARKPSLSACNTRGWT